MVASQREVPAARGHLIKRPRLTRILDESKGRIMLLVAPAGYGKTTLAREWLEGKPHVWYRASSADADVAALAVGIATAAAQLVPGVDRRIRERMRAARDPEREAGALAEILADDLSPLEHGTWIVIDDYQFIAESIASDLFVREFLERGQGQLLVTSRRRPKWANARSIIYGKTVLVGRRELAMTDEEVALAVGRTSAEAPALFENAMGWPAVVGLAARVGPTRLEGHELPHDLYSFFAEELWHFLPEERQWQLSQLALASPMPSGAAEDLFGASSTGLVELGAREGWLVRDGAEIVIHPLLRRFLRTRFDSFPPDTRLGAIQRLIEILTGRQQWDQAMDLALDADEPAVSSIFERSLDGLLSSGRLPTVERWLTRARTLQIDAPVLSLAASEVAFRRGEYARAEALARTAAARSDDWSLRVRALNRAGLSARLLDRVDAAFALHQEARALARDMPSLRESIIGEVSAALDLGMPDSDKLLSRLPPDDGSPIDLLRRAAVAIQVALRLGGIEQAVQATTPLVPVLKDVDDPLARSGFLFVRAAALVATARYREAIHVLASLADETTKYRLDFAVSQTRALRAVAEAGVRNFERARLLTAECVASAQRDGESYGATNAHAIEARIEVASRSGIVPPVRPNLSAAAVVSVYAEYVLSIALAEACFGSPDRARALIAEATAGYLNAEAEVLASWVRAILHVEDEDTTRAAFSLTLKRGFIDGFVVAYRGCPKLLEALMSSDYRDEVAQILVRANDVELADALALGRVANQARRQRLTKRELDVYRLMVEGLQNRAIAQRLFITESTAKLHVRHILEKLCARSRAEAVAKWRDVLD